MKNPPQQFQSLLPFSDQFQFKNFTFDISQYPNQQQKQQIEQKLKHLAKLHKHYQSQSTLSPDQIEFMYQHIVSFNERNFSMNNNLGFVALTKYLHQIQFGKIVGINLNSCKIDNVEGLTNLNAPFLLVLELYCNNITNLKPLTKNNHLKQLGTITLYKNPLISMQTLQRSFTPKLNYFQLDIHQNNNIVCEDLNFIYKLPYRYQGIKVRTWHNCMHRIMRPIQIFIDKFGDITRNA